MIGEFEFGGVFIPSLLIWGILAIAISIFLRRVLIIVGFYRLVWHRGLFDLALIIVLWGSVTALAANYGLESMQIP